MTEVVQLISTTGFPIAMCLLMAWFINKTLSSIKTALENNTAMVGKLVDKIDKEDKL